MAAKQKINKIILSTDTLSGYWLDHIFEIAKKVWFDWIDLATWKNFDARNASYVLKLANTHKLPVVSVQVSNQVNKREMEQAFQLCEQLGVDRITVNAPRTFDFKTYNFITNSLRDFHRQKTNISFSLINPDESHILWIIPKFRFRNIADSIKNHKTHIALDVANMEEETFERYFIKRFKSFKPYIDIIYLSDKDKQGKGHLPLGEWSLKIPTLLKTLHKHEYKHPLSIKLNINKKDLADNEKVELILGKCIRYIKDNLPS